MANQSLIDIGSRLQGFLLRKGASGTCLGPEAGGVRGAFFVGGLAVGLELWCGVPWCGLGHKKSAGLASQNG
jgi:hypothetical protein